MDEPKIYPYHLAAAFGKGGDDLKTLTDIFPKTAKARSDTNYQVIVSNEVDFLKDFEQKYGDSLPTETISYGSTEWGNSYASLAEVSASVKRSIEKLRTAEAIYTMVAIKDKKFAAGLTEQKEQAWQACGLYFEHNWTADGPHITRKQRADWQRKIAAQINGYVDTLYNLSVKRLGELIVKPSGQNESFYVFNSLGWARNDYSDYPYNGPTSIHILDKTIAKEVPFQFIKKKDKSYIRLWATHVPSLGYKIFEIRKNVAPATVSASIITTDSTIENNFYKVKFTRQGVITSLIDKANNKEYVKPFDKLYFNDLGAGLGNDGDPMQLENKGVVSTTLSAFSYKPIKHTSKLTLFANSDRIELENYIIQNTGEKTQAYSFCTNLDKPDVWHEEAGAILHAKSISKGGHYSDTACRVDWLALNHFADMSDNENGLTISNRDAYFMKTGESTVRNLDDTSAYLKILATGRVDPYLGMENQDGDSYFEDFLALKIHAGGLKPADAMRFAMEHQNPLIAANISGGKAYKDRQFSMFSISDSNVLAWALKPSEEGVANGIIMRMWNLSDADKQIQISAKAPLAKAFSTTHIETDDQPVPLGDGKLITIITHNRLQTFRVFLK